MKMTAQRFDELRQTITIHNIPLKDASTDEVFREWEGGMYLDSACGLTEEQDERLTAVERELMSRPETNEPREN